MRYALLGDIHSSKEDLKKVLAHISAQVPDAELIGTGDLFECTVSKKDITNHKHEVLEEVMLIPDGFTDLLTFRSVSGNQEDRILLLTEKVDPRRLKITELPETITLGGDGQIIHGHQWKWGGEPWALVEANPTNTLMFFGHSHQSALVINGVSQNIKFGLPYYLEGVTILVNVGAVIKDREWVLYDSVGKMVTFMKA